SCTSCSTRIRRLAWDGGSRPRMDYRSPKPPHGGMTRPVSNWIAPPAPNRRYSQHRLRPYNALLRILISAGEASGEMYGAQLIEALRRAAERTPAELCSAGQPGAAVPTLATHSTRASFPPPASQPPHDSKLEFFGVGGERMRAAGCDTVVDAKDLSVVGITEILSHLPKIYGLYRQLIQEADRRKPDLAIVIDSPAFNWRVAREMRKRGVTTVYYVAPQFWAWRQGR